MVELFYAYGGLISSTNQVWLQWELDIVIGLFDKFGIITNVEKMLEMVCQNGPISRQKYFTSYGCQMTRKGYPHCVKQFRIGVWEVWSRVLSGIHGLTPPYVARTVIIG